MQRNGLSPSGEQLAEYMEIPIAEVEDLLACELRSVTVSLQGVVKSKSDPSELVDVLPSEELPPLERAEIAERSASVWSLLAKANLTPKEHTVVTLRFGQQGPHGRGAFSDLGPFKRRELLAWQHIHQLGGIRFRFHNLSLIHI